MFMKVDGVTGESKDSNHTGWTDITSFSWGASQPGNMSVGGGGGAGMRSAVAAFSGGARGRDADDHGRPRYRQRPVSRLPAGTAGGRPYRAQLALLRRAPCRHRLLLSRRVARLAARRSVDATRHGVFTRSVT